MKKQNSKNIGKKTVFKNIKKNQENINDKFSFSSSIKTYDKNSSSSSNPFKKRINNIPRKKYINSREISIKALVNSKKKYISGQKENNIKIDKKSIIILIKRVNDLKSQQNKTTESLNDLKKDINNLKDDQKITNTLLSQLINMFKTNNDKNYKKEDIIEGKNKNHQKEDIVEENSKRKKYNKSEDNKSIFSEKTPIDQKERFIKFYDNYNDKTLIDSFLENFINNMSNNLSDNSNSKKENDLNIKKTKEDQINIKNVNLNRNVIKKINLVRKNIK